MPERLAFRLKVIFGANAEASEVVLGAGVPIVLTSRADSVCTRRAGVAVAVLHAHAVRRGLNPRD